MQEIARQYFHGDGPTKSVTECCRRLFCNILPNAIWGLGALQALGIEQERLNSLPLPNSLRYGLSQQWSVTSHSMQLGCKSSRSERARPDGFSICLPSGIGILGVREWVNKLTEAALLGSAGCARGDISRQTGIPLRYDRSTKSPCRIAGGFPARLG